MTSKKKEKKPSNRSNWKKTRYEGHVPEKDRSRSLRRLAKEAKTFASESHPED